MATGQQRKAAAAGGGSGLGIGPGAPATAAGGGPLGLPTAAPFQLPPHHHASLAGSGGVVGVGVGVGGGPEGGSSGAVASQMMASLLAAAKRSVEGAGPPGPPGGGGLPFLPTSAAAALSPLVPPARPGHLVSSYPVSLSSSAESPAAALALAALSSDQRGGQPTQGSFGLWPAMGHAAAATAAHLSAHRGPPGAAAGAKGNGHPYAPFLHPPSAAAAAAPTTIVSTSSASSLSSAATAAAAPNPMAGAGGSGTGAGNGWDSYVRDGLGPPHGRQGPLTGAAAAAAAAARPQGGSKRPRTGAEAGADAGTMTGEWETKPLLDARGMLASSSSSHSHQHSPQPPHPSLSAEERLCVTRERNRDHSRKSRLRKKEFIQGLQRQVDDLGLFKLLVEQVADPLAVVSADDRLTFLYASPAWMRELGYDPVVLHEQAIDVIKIVAAEDVALLLRQVQKALVYGEAPKVPLRVRHASGRMEAGEASLRLMPGRQLALVLRLRGPPSEGAV